MSDIMQDKRGYVLPEDAAKMIGAARNESEKLFLKLMWDTGRRVSELVGKYGITPGSIDTDNSAILFTILKKKTDSNGQRPTKWKPVSRELVEEIKGFCQRVGIGNGDKIWPKGRRWAHRAFNYAATSSGVKGVNGKLPHPHMFRHSFAVRATKVSTTATDLRGLQDILEHSKITTTEVYIQFNPADARALMDKMNKSDTNDTRAA